MINKDLLKTINQFTPIDHVILDYLHYIHLLKNSNDSHEDIIPKVTSMYYVLHKEINPNLKVINIENELHELCLNTDNKFTHRRLFFNEIFINRRFVFYDAFIINGIYLIQTDSNIIKIIILISEMNNTDVQYRWIIGHIENECVNFTNQSTSDKSLIKIVNKLQTYCCNIIDFVENQTHEYEMVINEYSREEDNKRKSKGKDPIHTQIYIRLNENIKQYVKQLREDTRKYGYKFMVRGHWRTLKADRYRKKEKMWIKPFFKGNGIYINKEVTIC